MKIFTKIGLALLVGLISTGMLFAQNSARELGPKTKSAGVPIASEDMFDLQFDWPVGIGGGEAGIESDGSYIYTSMWNGAGEFQKYDLSGNWVETFTVAGSTGCRDIAFDGTYFYGGAAATTVFQMDFASASMVSTFTAPVAVRAIAYDEDEDAFYANNWSDDITKFDMAGANLGSFPVGPTGISYYGFAYQGAGYCGDGPYLWGYAQTGATLNELVQISLPGGAETGTYFDVGSVAAVGTGIAGGLAIADGIVSGYWTILGTAQNVDIWGLELCSSGPLPTNDLGVQVISQPASGLNLTGAEPVTITVKNYGTATQTSFDVEFTFDGGTPVVESVSTTLNSGDTYDHTFATTVDLSAYGTYSIDACVTLTGDENSANDCKSKTVENIEPSLCLDGLYATGCDFGDGLIYWDLADVNGVSIACDGVPYAWYHDFTDMIHTFEPGMTYTLTMQAGYSSTYVDVWVDWNDDLFMDDAEHLVDDFVCTDANVDYTVDITIPADAPAGNHTLRYRTNWLSGIAGSCDGVTYGNMCDFTAAVSGGLEYCEASGGGDEFIDGVEFGDISNLTSGENGYEDWTSLSTDVEQGGTYQLTVYNGNAYTSDDWGVWIDFNMDGTFADDEMLVCDISNGGDMIMYDIAIPGDAPLGSTRMRVRLKWSGSDCPFDPCGTTSYGEVEDYTVNVVEGMPSTAIFFDDFEAYNAGEQLACQNPADWTTWSNAPCDATEDAWVSDAYAYSGSNSVNIVQNNDLVHNFDTYFTTGAYNVSLMIYVPSGNDGYFNVMTDFDGAYEWGFEAYFNVGGDGSINAGATGAATFTFDFDTWMMATVMVDLDNDMAQFWLDGSMIHEWQWTLGANGAGAQLQLAAVDIFGANATTDFYFDDFTIEEAGMVTLDPPTNLQATVDMTDVYLTWDAPGGKGSFTANGATIGAPAMEISSAANNTPYPPSDAQFDLLFDVPVGVGGGEAGIETDGNYIYTSKWNGAGEFYRYDASGNYIDAFTIAAATGCRDIAYDGTYFYGGAASTTIFEMDFDAQTLVSTFTGPAACRAVAYNENDDAFYCNNWSDDITKFDKTGANLGSFPCGVSAPSYYGLAYDNYSGGEYLWGYSQTGATSNELIQMELPSGAETGLTFDVGSVAAVGTGIAGGLCIDGAIVPGYWAIIGTSQNVNLWGLELAGGGSSDISYNVYRDGAMIASTGSTNYADMGLANGTYDYFVTAVYETGESDPSNTASATVNYTPPAGDCEDFDDLTVGGYVAGQLGGLWTTWSGAPGTAEDAIVSDMYSVSPDNSILVEGTTDLVQLFNDENLTAGAWEFTFNIYVPTGKTGYFNLQKDVVPGTEWGFQAMFEDDMTIVVDGGAAGAAIIPYAYDTWYAIKLMVDLDNDWCQFYIDENLELEYQWTLGTFGTAGALTLGGANFFANPGAGGTPPGAHFDDHCFTGSSAAPCDNFDDLTVGGFVAEQLGGLWTTWTGSPGSAEDAPVSDVQSNSPSNSFQVNAATIDLVRQFGASAISTGQWMYTHYMYVPSGNSGYFNVQTDPTAGVGWNIEIYFDDGGTGSFAGQSTETFTYSQDTWFMVTINYDLESGFAYIMFDDEMILLFENTLTIGGIDYYGANSGGDPGAYYDDVCFGPGEIIEPDVCYNFDDLTVGGFVAEQLGDPWTTWSGSPGSAEDAPVSDAQSNSPGNSFQVNASTIDLVLQFGDAPIDQGQWLYTHYMYVPSGFSGYFNVQDEPTAGVGWNLEIFFDDGGTGSFAGQSTETFTYDQDTWFMVEINYDFETGYAVVKFDGEEIMWFANAQTIGGIDYYGSTGGGAPGAYYDDVCFDEGYSFMPALPPAPINLVGPEIVSINNDIVLTWDPPATSASLQWDNGINNDAIGLTSGGTFSVASHWEPADLAQYNGMMLEEITFFAGDYPGPSFTMKVWTGSNATEVSSEPVASFVQNDWNTVALSTPVMIDASQDLWFGYETTHAAGEYPAGCDAGPAIQTYGDMILNGGAWSSLYVLTGGAIDANWNIVGSASFADGSKSTTNSVVMSKPIAPVKSNGSLSALGFGSGKKYIPSSAKGVDGYNVYRDGSKINSAMVLETTYTDVVGVSGIYVYNVTAIWDGGTESGYSDPWTVEVITGVDEQVQSATQVFPNPAKELVNIASEFTINSVIVYNFSGQVVANEKVNGNEYQVNVNQYQPGIYVFQISTAKGIANYRIVVE